MSIDIHRYIDIDISSGGWSIRVDFYETRVTQMMTGFSFGSYGG